MRIRYNEEIMNNGNDNNDIWQQYWVSRSSDLRDQLMGIYLPLVIQRADRILKGLGGSFDRDHLISAGIFGLRDSIEEYSPNHTVLFEKHAQKNIRRVIIKKAKSSPPAWRALPNTHRLIVMLRYYEKVKFNNIAKLLDISCEEVKTKYNDALAKITHILPNI